MSKPNLNCKTLIIAELSANHGHCLESALATVRAAKEAGADAVKLQTYTADTITIDSDKPCFRIEHGTIWDGNTLYTLYKQAYTPWEWHKAIFNEARRIGLLAFSTPFDFSAVDFLESLDNPIYKIASFEINDIPLIEYVASKKKPIIISTGVASLEEIQEAVDVCRYAGNDDITLLKCTSSYPAPIDRANLKTIPDMVNRFGVKVGLSDHTIGAVAALAAVALGATVIEKHFILDKSIGGPDASFSMEPADFSIMVNGIRAVEKALGKVSYELDASAQKQAHFKRSLFVAEDVKAGDLISKTNVRSIRPSDGLHPRYYPQILGRCFIRDVEKGTPLTLELFEKTGFVL